MCTALSFQYNTHFFGRNLDLDYSLSEAITITPRRFPLTFRHLPTLTDHYAILGMAHIADGYPLYYDAMNEKGLCIAGLRFPSAMYEKTPSEQHDNVASFELIPYLLASCATLAEARAKLSRLRLTADAFSAAFAPAPLHWLLADHTGAIVIEPTADGMHCYDDPIGVLTNEPPFPMQLFSLNNYMHLSPDAPENRFLPTMPLLPYSFGMGALGLPGDWSSPSRYIRAVFAKAHAKCGETPPVLQFFHLLSAVAMPKGCVRLPNGNCEYTRYMSCCDTASQTYHCRTYDRDTTLSVKLKPDGSTLTAYAIG